MWKGEGKAKEKDTKEMEKAKGTKGKEKESATTVVRPGTWQETASSRSRKAREKERASHFMDGATTATNKGTWREIAGAEKEESIQQNNQNQTVDWISVEDEAEKQRESEEEQSQGLANYGEWNYEGPNCEYYGGEWGGYWCAPIMKGRGRGTNVQSG